MSTAVGVHVLPECATKGSVYWRTGGDHKITLLDGLNSILLYKLECFLGISTTERNRITTIIVIFHVFEIANQLLARHSLYLAP